MYNLLIGTYNNYFNRIVKKEETDFRYFTVMGNTLSIKNINFNPNDGIYTKVILGKGDYLLPESITRPIQPDYAILYKTELENPPYADAQIVSRWFVIEAVRTRKGQYELTLKRDVIADNYGDVVSAPIYLEKGYINDVTNPLLYNKESLEVNQIKQYEVPIQDETKTGWVVGYIPNTWAGTTVEPKVIIPANADITVAGIANWEYYYCCDLNPSWKPIWDNTASRENIIKIKSSYLTSKGKQHWYCQSAWWREYHNTSAAENVHMSGGPNTESTTAPASWTNWSNLRWTDSNQHFGMGQSQANYMVAPLKLQPTFENYMNAFIRKKLDCAAGDKNAVMGLEGKTIYDSVSGLYYRIKIAWQSPYQRGGQDTYFTADNDTTDNNLVNYVNSNIRKTGFTEGSLSGSVGLGDVGFYTNDSLVYIVLEQNAVDVECTIDTVRAHLEDAPYDMFCIPYSDTLKIYDGETTFTCNKAVALSMATAIGEEGGAGSVFDVQLLPYCPVREVILRSTNPSKTIDISTVSFDLITQKTTGTKLNAVIWAPRSTFTFDVNELDNITYCKFRKPETAITGSSLPTQKYLFIKDTLSDSILLADSYINYPLKSRLKVYKVDKATGTVIETVDSPNTIELCVENGARHLKLYKVLPAVTIYDDTVTNYNAESWQFLIYLQIVPGTSQNIDIFADAIAYPTQIYYDVDLTTPEAAKLTNECNMYRLSAGNQGSIFEFSPAKSFGFSGYKVDCTYKPYQPWIHVIPKLGGLYGENFVTIDDNRGLILGGDYSLTQLTNTWATYKLQNCTYQDMFNREIAHLDVEHSIQEQEQWFQSMSGILTGGTSGGVAGGMAGGGWGAVAGAAVGTLTGGIGAGLDIENMYKKQYEEKDYKTDMYNYNLKNIQAIPSALAKTSSFVYNTRIWPFLEVYTCTDVEREAVANKIKYDGMTMMVIGKIEDYLESGVQHFWRGNLIRLPALEDDSHVANEIYSELKKGVYL